MKTPRAFIIGGGVTGLAAGRATGYPVLEAGNEPGGICASYYVEPHSNKRLYRPPRDGEAYRFEIGGGHWIFGGDPKILRLIQKLAPAKQYSRRSSVFFSKEKRLVPFPIQDHLRYFDDGTARRVIREISRPKKTGGDTLKDWLKARFGGTLCRLFFDPFHDRYTGGLHRSVRPQDDYKSPLDLRRIRKGATGSRTAAAGYNTMYLYPKDGLDHLARRLAAPCRVRYGQRVKRIDTKRKELLMDGGRTLGYDRLISTLPLNQLVRIAGLGEHNGNFPHTSVLVINIGAERGPRLGDEHWVYTADSNTGFHRVGFYSHVDRSFLPASDRKKPRRASLYVEKAYANGQKPSGREVSRLVRETIRELQEWGLIGEVEVVDPTWIEVGYTWNLPGTTRSGDALNKAASHGIASVGRYGAWKFQGIADSIRDGLSLGAH